MLSLESRISPPMLPFRFHYQGFTCKYVEVDDAVLLINDFIIVVEVKRKSVWRFALYTLLLPHGRGFLCIQVSLSPVLVYLLLLQYFHSVSKHGWYIIMRRFVNMVLHLDLYR